MCTKGHKDWGWKGSVCVLGGCEGCGVCVQETLESCSHPEDPHDPQGTHGLQRALQLLSSATFPCSSSLPIQGAWGHVGWSHLERGIPSQQQLLAEGTSSASRAETPLPHEPLHYKPACSSTQTIRNVHPRSIFT